MRESKLYKLIVLACLGIVAADAAMDLAQYWREAHGDACGCGEPEADIFADE